MQFDPWLFWAPMAAGLLCIGVLARSFLSWDILSLRVRWPISVKLQAIAPALLSFAVWLLLVWLWYNYLATHGTAPAFGGSVIAYCLLAVAMAFAVYKSFDVLARRVLRPGFERPGGGESGSGSEYWQDVDLSR